MSFEYQPVCKHINIFANANMLVGSGAALRPPTSAPPRQAKPDLVRYFWEGGAPTIQRGNRAEAIQIMRARRGEEDRRQYNKAEVGEEKEEDKEDEEEEGEEK